VCRDYTEKRGHEKGSDLFSLDRYEFDSAAAILLVILSNVIVSEWVSTKVRHAII
jgi:ABC-type phosphate/phosphonate transport system permease subunit